MAPRARPPRTGPSRGGPARHARAARSRAAAAEARGEAQAARVGAADAAQPTIADPAALAERLGHRFARPVLLEEALTHPSAAAGRPSNQRLEFLGDRVLGLIVAEALLAAHPGEEEGALAPRLNQLVRRETLAEIAAALDLGAFIRLGSSERLSGGRRKQAILADALEAVIAALYLDGGLEAARRFVHAAWGARLAAGGEVPVDPKTRLQEWAQARGMTPPAYEVLARAGPDHAPSFTIRARLESGESAEGRAPSKKAAEQAAAAALLARLEPGGER